MFFTHMTRIQILRSGRWLTKENVVANFVTLLDLYCRAVGGIIFFEYLGISYTLNINWKCWVVWATYCTRCQKKHTRLMDVLIQSDPWTLFITAFLETKYLYLAERN